MSALRSCRSDDLGIVDETVDQRHHAGGVGEHLTPFGKGAVGGDQRAFVLIPPRDQLEHQVGVTIGVGEIADFIDDQQLWPGVMPQAATQRGVAVQCGEMPSSWPALVNSTVCPSIRAWWAIFCATIDLPTPFGPTSTT